MKKIILISLTLLFYIKGFSQGLIFDKENFKKTPQWVAPQKMGFSEQDLPTKISYRKYCPMPHNQGDLFTCVGWAVAYGALSTQYNIQMNVTNKIEKWSRAFDPHFIYGYAKNTADLWCQQGSSIVTALLTLEEIGCKPKIWEPWLKCQDENAFTDFSKSLAAPYKIEESRVLSLDNIVRDVKMALFFQLPVVIGANLTESFNPLLLKSGVWNPKDGEKELGGHAMCVIGYDDKRNGGCFEVMNSWGKECGDSGFVWIRYKDFKRTVSEAYIIQTQKLNSNSCSIGDCVNGYSRYKFDNGEIYEGFITNNNLQGWGAYLYKDGSLYVGGWNGGRKNGPGLIYDKATNAFYNTNYKNDILTNYVDKVNGFALSDTDKKSLDKIEELRKILPASIVNDADFDKTQKALSKYEAPDKPMKIGTK